MKALRISILLCLAVAAFSASAQGITTFGAPDCGKWLNSPQATHKAWLLGFLSGENRQLSVAAGRNYDPLDQLGSADQAFAWMDNYCRSNPLESVYAGGIRLMLELEARVPAKRRQ